MVKKKKYNYDINNYYIAGRRVKDIVNNITPGTEQKYDVD